MVNLNARVKHKRDTNSNWTSHNPIILDGEIVIVDTDDGEVRTKIGDGVTSYAQLPFSDDTVRSLIEEIELTPGADGYTPIKGTDYFTDDDKAEIVSDTKESLPTVTLVATLEDDTTVTYTLYGEVVS